MAKSDRYETAFRAGKRAAERGEAKSQYLSSYGTREERMGFEAGYYAGVVEASRAAQAKKEKTNVR